ncbi:hypothetical protein [Methylorubrum salsuginis]|uniref:Uncharacterized protein n=1 Tax=Methylorubrum salsuginis TaxID=414703 RepID=A0A1I4A245_9HYPH|nr:hypothetical protein [Methylorubrum salsuginis]SFK50415.1 hypothetical protein SAMN04488125_102209 [Methylorubrum salsuginis]
MNQTISTLNQRQMRALQWLADQEAHQWIPVHDSGPCRTTLNALVRRGLAVRSSANADYYRITMHGRAVSPMV